MMGKRVVVSLLALFAAGTTAWGQSLWTSAEMKVGVTDGLKLYAEGEYRTHDGLSATERWAVSAGADYKLCRYLKMTAGYTYIRQQTQAEITRKGNIIPAYWQSKHRVSLALTGSYEWKRFAFSLRERYQYTFRPELYVPKFDDDGVTPKDDELVTTKHKHVLRSRLEIEYNIAKSRFSPFVSGELYHSFSGMTFEKSRWTAGTEYKFNKKHAMEVFYRYVNQGDDDEPGGHVIGVGYRFKL